MLAWLDPETALKRGRTPAAEDVAARVAAILAAVRAEGDEALVRLTEELDGAHLTAGALEIPGDELEAAWKGLAPDVKRDLELASSRIEAYHRAQLTGAPAPVVSGGLSLSERIEPLARVGFYVPGGTAPLVSTVLMSLVPAVVAGVAERILVTPPDTKGRVNAALMGACHLAGATRVFRVGGAQAVAALAFGTAHVPAVEKVVGPGNRFVTEAKRQVYGHVDIDGLMGPSEVLIVAAGAVDPQWIAWDLLAQAEHDPLASAVLVTWDPALARRVEPELERLLADLPRREVARASLSVRGAVVVVDGPEAAAAFVDAWAPEHAQVMVGDPGLARRVIRGIHRAGALFVGERVAEAVGDYVAGPSHVLPTGGSARFASGLGVETFRRRMHVIEARPGPDPELLAGAAHLAVLEGLWGHAGSLRARGVA